MKKLLLTTLENTINACLRLDPDSAARLQKLAGKVMTIELLPFHFIFQVTPQNDYLSLQEDDVLVADVALRGTPLQLFGAACAKEQRQRFFAEDLVIEGNAELGQQVIDLFERLHIDWEEHLSQLIGDAPAYYASQFLQHTRDFFSRASESLSNSVNEYMHEEAQWFPTREALNDLFNDIDTLRLDVDRIEAKIKEIT